MFEEEEVAARLEVEVSLAAFPTLRDLFVSVDVNNEVVGTRTLPPSSTCMASFNKPRKDSILLEGSNQVLSQMSLISMYKTPMPHSRAVA